LKIFAFSSGKPAAYTISARQAGGLPAASFRLHLAMDALAVRLPVPPAGSIEDLHFQAAHPRRRALPGAQKKTALTLGECGTLGVFTP